MIRALFDLPPNEGAATEVAPGVLWMRLPLPMALDHVNVYALEEEGGWTVVDTGFDSRRGRAIWTALREGPLAGRPILRVIGTHHHPDHIGLAGWLMARRGRADDVAHGLADGADADARRAGPARARDAGFLAPGRDAAPTLLERRASERPFNFADMVHPLPLGFTRLVDGQHVTFGRRRWRVAMGHGHAPCHATFWSLDDDLVIGGDQLLPGISPNLGVYPTEPEADPVGEWLDSCTKMLALAEPRHHWSCRATSCLSPVCRRA